MTNPVVAPPADKVESRMNEEIDHLWSLKHYAEAVATLERSADAGLLAVSLSVSIALATRIRSERLRKRSAAWRAEVAKRNDELGIPNCDHVIADPDCDECQKVPTKKERS